MFACPLNKVYACSGSAMQRSPHNRDGKASNSLAKYNKLAKLRRHASRVHFAFTLDKNPMLSPTVIGVVLHRLGLKYNFGQVEVQRGEAELNLDLDSVALSGVNAGPPRATSVKSISAKLKSNSASPRWTSTWPRWT